MRELLRSRWARLAALVLVLALLGWLLHLLKGVLAPFLLAFALAYFLNPAVNAMEGVFERRVGRMPFLRRWLDPRAAAVAILTVATLAVVVVALVIVVPAVTHQVSETASRLPEYTRTLRAKVEPTIQRLNLRYPAEFEQLRERLEETVKGHLPQILSPITHVFQAAFSSFLAFVLLVLHIVVIPVFTVYLLYDMNQIRQGARDLIPPRYQGYVTSRLGEVDRLLSAFVRGQITVCLMLGTFYAIALTFCHVPMGLLVGYAVAFFNLVPFMSTALGLPLVLLLKFIDEPALPGLITVAAIFVVGHFVEGHFITPRIVGQKLGLHPVVIMLAVLVGGTLFGFVGMLVAVPTTAALSVFWADLRALYLQSAFFHGNATPPGAA